MTAIGKTLRQLTRGRVAAALHVCCSPYGMTRSRASTARMAVAACAGAGIVATTLLSDSCRADSPVQVNLDKGYAARTTNPLAVIRKRAALPSVPGEPQYTVEEVAMHNRPGDMWVTYKDGVYDVSEFAQVHPGGRKFLQAAAGGSVDALWAYWHFHHVSTKVEGYLRQCRIGALSDWQGDDVEGVDMYEADPGGEPDSDRPLLRSPAQIALFDRPWNSETAAAALDASYLTPNDAVYVRNHAPVPQGLSPISHRVTFSTGNYAEDALSDIADFSLADLQMKFGTKQITAVLQCSGNRAAENIRANGPSGFSGVNYENMKCGMVANVQWRGVSLAFVLQQVYPELQLSPGEPTEGPGARYVEFHGADGYYASVPLARVVDSDNDCMLATHMNGEPLPHDHGYPVRALLPGIVGARSVKWLERVVVRRGEGDSPWNNYYYKNKSLPVQSDGAFPSCQSLPLNSLVLSAVSDPRQPATAKVSGVAYSGGTGDQISSVEVSGDSGQTWHAMELVNADMDSEDASSRYWKWVQWRGTVEISRHYAEEVLCRAFADGGAKGQPQVSGQRGGYLYNGWHRVKVESICDDA